MIDWLKKINKEYPEFWKKYLSQFDKKPTRFVVLCTETTGLNPVKDVILSMSSIAIINDAIYVGDSFEVVLLQYVYNHDNGLSNEFIIESTQPKFQESEAIKAFVEYLGNATLIGYKINFEIEMINEALSKLNCGKLKNEALDIEVIYQKWKELSDTTKFSIQELQTIFNIESSNKVSVSNDAYIIALIFLKIKNKIRNKLTL